MSFCSVNLLCGGRGMNSLTLWAWVLVVHDHLAYLCVQLTRRINGSGYHQCRYYSHCSNPHDDLRVWVLHRHTTTARPLRMGLVCGGVAQVVCGWESLRLRGLRFYFLRLRRKPLRLRGLRRLRVFRVRVRGVFVYGVSPACLLGVCVVLACFQRFPRSMCSMCSMCSTSCMGGGS